MIEAGFIHEHEHDPKFPSIHGLVDQLGTFDDAIDAVRVMAKVAGDAPLVEKPEPKEHFLREVFKGEAAQNALAGIVAKALSRLVPDSSGRWDIQYK